MKKTARRFAAAFALLFLLQGKAESNTYETYLEDGTVPSLKNHYDGKTEIGISSTAVNRAEEEKTEQIAKQCGLITCEDLMQGRYLLDRGRSKKSNNTEQARITILKTEDLLDFSLEHHMHVHGATIVQPANIPEWFFNEAWSNDTKAEKAARTTIIRRMENAIRDQIRQINEKYPGVITAWEVVRSGKSAENDLFRETIGEEYVRIAFRTARENASEEQKLLWMLAEPPENDVINEIRELKEDGLLDGVVLICSMTLDESELIRLEETLQNISETGAEIHLSGLEIASTDRTAAGEMRLAVRYKSLFILAEKYSIRSISLPELQDPADREKGTPPRLINEKGRLTPAFFGALQDDMIPLNGEEEAIRAAVTSTDLEAAIKKEADPVIVYKKPENHNPVMTQRFGADPWAMVYNDRVYLYMTGDEPVIKNGEKPKTNDYSNIVTLRVLSSDDLVNWTDHGSVRAAGSSGAAKWASNSWAPCAAWKNIGGKDRFFLYFANSGGGIGVLTSDNPTGPFTDPIGKPLISRDTPTCSSVTWLFDPAVLTDEDGSAYLYFGGGIPEGKQADPGTARVVKLGEDMISLDGDPVAIHPPWLFEDSGINKFGETYVYSYCSNFNVPAAGSPQGFGSGEIVYMTSDSPMGPFTYAGRVLRNPGFFFGVGGNNHHCMFQFQGQWYITYHAATIDRAMGWNAGYRSTFVDRLELNGKGLPAPSNATAAGVVQLKPFDPYKPNCGATAVSMAGVTTELANPDDKKAGTGAMTAVSTAPDGWVAVSGADFGEKGASAVRMKVRSEVPGRIEILTGLENSEPILSLEIAAGESYTDVTAELPEKLRGIHDIYFCFSESGTALLEWQFRQEP